MIDVLIRGGKVIDGTGAPWFRADVAVQDGKIAAVERRPLTVHLVGQPEGAAATTVLDATGCFVTPGFVDPHTHSDLPLLVNPPAESQVRQGVTTVVIGNCGSAPAPIGPLNGAFLNRRIGERAAGQGLRRDWRTFGEYFDRLRRQGVAVNVAPLAGHATLRGEVMGMERRPPTADELAAMCRLLDEALDDGVFGVSTGLIYPPSSYADTDEIVALAEVAARRGGLYFSHIRGEGDTLLDAVDEAIEIGRRAALPVQIAHHKAARPPNWGKTVQTLEMMQAARADGVDVAYDSYPYIASSSGLGSLLPDWAHEGGAPALLARLRSPIERKRVVAGIRERAAGIEGWHTIIVSWVPTAAHKSWEGQTIERIGAALGLSGEETVAHVLDTLGGAAHMVYFQLDEADVCRVLAHPLGMIGSDGSVAAPYGPLSEGKPHPRSYGTHPRVLGRYVRDLGLFTWEEAIRKMTSAPAQRLGLAAKGIVRPGLDADLVIFDPATVSDRATFEEPHQYPDGIEHVLVNGELVVSGGNHLGTLPGQVLTRP